MADAISLSEPPEWDNLASALDFLASVPEETTLQVAWARAWNNLLRNTTAVATARKLTWLQSLAQNIPNDEPQALADVLQAQGDGLSFLDQREEALSRYEEALGLYRQVGDRLGEANVLKAQGNLALAQGQTASAVQWLDQAVTIHHAIGDLYSEAADRYYRALAYLAWGKIPPAREDLRFAEAVFRRLGLPYADWCTQKLSEIEV